MAHAEQCDKCGVQRSGGPDGTSGRCATRSCKPSRSWHAIGAVLVPECQFQVGSGSRWEAEQPVNKAPTPPSWYKSSLLSSDSFERSVDSQPRSRYTVTEMELKVRKLEAGDFEKGMKDAY